MGRNRLAFGGVAALAFVLAAVLLSSPAGAVVYNYSLDIGQYAYQAYYWSDSLPRTLTIHIVVNADSLNADIVDVYLYDSTNYATYLQFNPNNRPFYLIGQEGVPEGSWTITGQFTPVAGASYYAVIDNTCTWGTCPTSAASGTFELTTEYVVQQHTLSGVIYQSSGIYCSTTVVPGASISLSPGGYSTAADANGHYAIVVPDNTYTVTVSKSGYQSTSSTVTISGADVTKDFCIAAQAPTTHRVSGHVYREGTSTGIASAQLSFNSGQYTTSTDSSGMYGVTVPDGTYGVAVTATGYQTRTDSVTVSGSDLSKDFYLAPTASATHQISGYVYKQGTTEGIAGATVAATPGSNAATANAAGFYSVAVPDGTYQVTASDNGYQSASVTVTVSGQDVTRNIELTPIGGGGQVGPAGQPFPASLLYAIIGIVVAGALVGFVVVRRRRARAPSPPPEAPPHTFGPPSAPSPPVPFPQVAPAGVRAPPMTKAAPMPARTSTPEGMIACPNCGRMLPEAAEFCASCGTRVR